MKRHPTAADFPQSPERGENGRPFCRMCGNEVPSGHRTFCSKECGEQLSEITSGNGNRTICWERDRGICQICGKDTDRGYRLFWEICFWTGAHAVDMPISNDPSIFADVFEVIFSAPKKGAWEADHIHPFAKGGAPQKDNLRTLCIKCHKAVTYLFAAERAKARRDRKRIPFPDWNGA